MSSTDMTYIRQAATGVETSVAVYFFLGCLLSLQITCNSANCVARMELTRQPTEMMASSAFRNQRSSSFSFLNIMPNKMLMGSKVLETTKCKCLCLCKHGHLHCLVTTSFLFSYCNHTQDIYRCIAQDQNSVTCQITGSLKHSVDKHLQYVWTTLPTHSPLHVDMPDSANYNWRGVSSLTH